MEDSKPDSREESLELGSYGSSHTEESESAEMQSLPRADGGKLAWMNVIACFMLETVVWGLPFSYGVLQEYYSTHAPFKKGATITAAISTTTIAIMYCTSPLIAAANQRWPWLRFRAAVLGLVIMNAALIGSSFCNSAILLLVTQGILYAMGGLILYFPAMYLIDEWFIRRKGLAFAIVYSGTYSGGAVMPFLLQWLLKQYGFRTTMRVWSVVLTVVTLPCIMMMSNRLPTNKSRVTPGKDLVFLKQPTFWIYQIPTTIQSLATFLPLIWLPSFAEAMKIPSFSGPLSVSLVNLSIGIGFIIQGELTDRFPTALTIGISTIGGMVSIFAFWGLATNQAMLYIFAIMWGLTGGSFPGSWTGCISDIRRRCEKLDTGMVISLFCLSRGLGSCLSGPISAQLLKMEPWTHLGFAYGSAYGPMIVYTGIGVTLGGLGPIVRLFVKS